MGDASQKIWVEVEGERFLVEILDINQRPITAIVEGSRFELELDEINPELENRTEPKSLQTHSVPGGAVCEVTSPMPGDIVQILVAPGQAVKAGDPLCVLDAMKMKNTIHAPQDGRIEKIFVTEGQTVEFGTELLRFK